MNDISLTSADLGPYDIENIVCRGCNGPLCGDKTPKLFEGELVFVCHLGPAGQEVLANAVARAKRDA